MRLALLWTLGPLGLLLVIYLWWKIMVLLGEIADLDPREITEAELMTKGMNQ